MSAMAKQLSYNFIFLFLSLSLNAQKQGQARIDSLTKEVNNYVFKCKDTCLSDTLKVLSLNLLGW